MRMARIIKSSSSSSSFSSSSYCVFFCCPFFWFFIKHRLTWAIEDVPPARPYCAPIARNATDFYSLDSAIKRRFQWPIQHFSWRKFVYIRRIRNRPSTHVKRFIWHTGEEKKSLRLRLFFSHDPFGERQQAMIVISGNRPRVAYTHTHPQKSLIAARMAADFCGKKKKKHEE